MPTVTGGRFGTVTTVTQDDGTSVTGEFEDCPKPQVPGVSQAARSEAAFAKLCGACPIPASSGLTNRHRLFRGGHRHANAALYRIVIVRMRWHQPTIDYARRRTAEGLSKRDIIRCLKRFVAREIYHALLDDHRVGAACAEAA